MNLTNFGDALLTVSSIAPIQADDPSTGRPSNHRTTVVSVKIPRFSAYTWLKYSYWYYNEESVELFKTRVVNQEWSNVLGATGSQKKTQEYQDLVDSAIEDCFPLITVRRKYTDLPWLNVKARRLIRRRKGVYRCEGF